MGKIATTVSLKQMCKQDSSRWYLDLLYNFKRFLWVGDLKQSHAKQKSTLPINYQIIKEHV